MLSTSFKELFANSNNIILHGDVYASLAYLEKSNLKIDCAITSPPYWGQRDYDVKGQLGTEETPDEFIAKLLIIFEKLKSILDDQGIFFLNIGDKYENKYGNSSKLMIPYRLANFMTEFGWILEDIIIWQKLNNMPSGVKNRLTNTYEPIFVFAKSKNNYYKKYIAENSFSKIVRVSLASSKTNHVAPYPEKLVFELLKLGIPNDSIILDPFSGSGTTTAAAKKLFNVKSFNNFLSGENNWNKIQQKKVKTIDIEVNEEFVQIIKARNKINDDSVIELKNMKYEINDVLEKINRNNTQYENYHSKSDNKLENFEYFQPNENVHNFNIKNNLNDFFNLAWGGELENQIDDDNIIFVRLENNCIENYYKFWILRQKGWVIRNIIIQYDDEMWYPVFFIVRDVKSLDYHFNLDKIRITTKSKDEKIVLPKSFIGIKVKKPSSYFLNPEEGFIVDYFGETNNENPLWLIVRWNSGKIEYFRFLEDNLKIKPEFNCIKCHTKLKRYYHYSKEVKCIKCETKLWKKDDYMIYISNIIHNPHDPISQIENYIKNKDYNNIEPKEDETTYSGKYKDMKKINIGQSPGAREMLNEDYFTIDRLYQIKQSMISDYLNIFRRRKKLAKKEIVEHFNGIRDNYTHTVGHWLRKDKGGSLPKYEDIEDLHQLLDLEENFFILLSTYCIKLVNVAYNKKGKNPGDYFEMKTVEFFEYISKVGQY